MASTIVQPGVPNEQMEMRASMGEAPAEVVAAAEERFPVPQPYKLGPLTIPNYYSATTQVFIAGLVNFLAVGTSRSPRGRWVLYLKRYSCLKHEMLKLTMYRHVLGSGKLGRRRPAERPNC